MNECVACGRVAVKHHIYSRKAYPQFKDCEWNWLYLCIDHHTHGGDAIHRIGRTSFIKKYKLESWLLERGWEFCYLSKKWIRNIE